VDGDVRRRNQHRRALHTGRRRELIHQAAWAWNEANYLRDDSEQYFDAVAQEEYDRLLLTARRLVRKVYPLGRQLLVDFFVDGHGDLVMVTGYDYENGLTDTVVR
jgi:hypothetical protein